VLLAPRLRQPRLRGLTPLQHHSELLTDLLGIALLAHNLN
jgi:hypothetical protein